MKLVIFGASGATGQHLLKQALAAGHDLKVVVRTPEKISLQAERLQVIQGDVLKPETIESALADQDAVLLVLGVSNKRLPTTLFSEGVQNVLHAMKRQGVSRFICVSASGFINDSKDAFMIKYVFKPLLQNILKHMYADLKRMETLVKASQLDWTLIRPARLTDGPHTQVYRTALDANVIGGASISRADLADCMLKQLSNSNTIGVAVGLAY
jgi:putative NADH-flavin reductase